MEELFSNALFYIIAFFIAVAVIALIKELFQKACSDPPNTPTTAYGGDYKLYDSYNSFAYVLDNTLRFVDAYREELPGGWIHISIYTDCTNDKFSTDHHRYYIYSIVFTVNVACWFESILYKHKDAKEFMQSFYAYNPSDNSFSYKLRVGASVNCVIPGEITRKKLFDWLDRYEKANPGRKLTRTSLGVQYSWN